MKRFTTHAARLAHLAVMCLIAGALLFIAGSRVRGLLAVSCQVIAIAAAVALPLGTWLAVLITKTSAPGRRAAAWLLVALLFVPLFLHAAAWQAACGHLGYWTQWAAAGGSASPLLAGVPGAGWLHGLAATPWVTLMVGAALAAIDPKAEESALLDAPPPGVLLRVTLPHAAVGAAAAALWVAVTIAAEMTVSNLLMVRTFAEEVYTQAVIGGLDPSSGVPASLGSRGLLAGVALLLLLGAWAMAFATRWALRSAAPSPAAWRWELPTGAPRAWAAAALWGPMALLVVVPLLNLTVQAGVTVERSGDGWRRGWSAAKAVHVTAQSVALHGEEIRTSAMLGVAVATGATSLGLVWAWGMCGARGTAAALLLLGVACLVTPGPLLGLGCIWLLNQPDDSALWPLTWLYDRTLLAPWVVQMVRATPVAVLILWPALSSVPRVLIDTACSEGAGWWGRLVRVAAPLRRRAVAAAWLAALAVSVGELAATKLVLPPGWTTTPERLFTLLHYGVDDRVAGLSLATLAWFLGGAAAAFLLARGEPVPQRSAR